MGRNTDSYTTRPTGPTLTVKALVSVILLFSVVGARTAQAQEFTATHYGESYNGYLLGCSGYGTYSSSNSSIVAVGGTYSTAWPCGTILEIEGPAGSLTAIRQDTCPGCGAGLIDLSEAGIIQVCGSLGSCTVRVR